MNRTNTTRNTLRRGALAIAVSSIVGSVWATGCSSTTPTQEQGTEQEVTLRGKLVLAPNTDAELERIGRPVLVRTSNKLHYVRQFLAASSGWAAKPLAGETLQIDPSQQGRTLTRVLPDGSAVVAQTNDAGVTHDVRTSARVLRYQLPRGPMMARAATVLDGYWTSPSRLEELVGPAGAPAVEYLQSTAPVGVIKTTQGDRVLVTVGYIFRRDLEDDDGRFVPPRDLRVGRGDQDERAGMLFQYWLVVPGTQSELLPIAQASVLYPGTMPAGAPLAPHGGALPIVQYVDPATSTFSTPGVARSVSNALALLRAVPASALHLNYLGDAVPMKPCLDGACARCPDAGAPQLVERP